MTSTELVPPNKTKSTTNDMHHKRSDFLKLLEYFKNGFCVTISANNLLKITYYVSKITSYTYFQIKFTSY